MAGVVEPHPRRERGNPLVGGVPSGRDGYPYLRLPRSFAGVARVSGYKICASVSSVVSSSSYTLCEPDSDHINGSRSSHHPKHFQFFSFECQK